MLLTCGVSTFTRWMENVWPASTHTSRCWIGREPDRLPLWSAAESLNERSPDEGHTTRPTLPPPPASQTERLDRAGSERRRTVAGTISPAKSCFVRITAGG